MVGRVGIEPPRCLAPVRLYRPPPLKPISSSYPLPHLRLFSSKPRSQSSNSLATISRGADKTRSLRPSYSCSASSITLADTLRIRVAEPNNLPNIKPPKVKSSSFRGVNRHSHENAHTLSCIIARVNEPLTYKWMVTVSIVS